jgi:hypothetical protein
LQKAGRAFLLRLVAEHGPLEAAQILRDLGMRSRRCRAKLPVMVRPDTFRALRDHDHLLAAYWPACERWAVLDCPSQRMGAVSRSFKPDRRDPRANDSRILTGRKMW